MKSKIFIINSFPRNDYSVKILEECISRLRGIGWNIMVVSHLPIPLEVQGQVDYFFYDSDNPLIESRTFSWFANSSLKITINHPGHMLAICRNIHSAISLAKILGYEYFYFTECDNLICQDELVNFDNFLGEMIEDQRSMIFHKSIWGGGGYETKLFGGSTKYFCQSLKLPLNYIDYEKFNIAGFLENDFYLNFSEFENNYLIKESREDGTLEGFTRSDMNRISNLGIVCGIFPSNDGYYIFLLNNLSREIVYFLDDKQISLSPGYYWYSRAIGDITIRIVDGDYSFTNIYQLTPENKIIYNSKGFLELYHEGDSGTGSIF
jgi:hypothetical protein